MPYLQDLFKYIGKYRPPTVELPTRLKPFIPEFIPAIGGSDEFIKVPRPDGRPDYLGLKVGSSWTQAEPGQQC
jgi:intraflagellar transport protein 46